MVELLIVIAVIGVLAVALLSSLNPLEQINKGRDTRTRSDAAQLLSSLDRYNTSIGYYPWQASEGENVNNGSPDVPWTQIKGGVTLNGTDVKTVFQVLSSTDEVKQTFIDRITGATYNSIYVYYNDEVRGSSTYTCFKPQSRSFAKEAYTRCQSPTGFIATSGAPATGVVAGPCPKADYSPAFETVVLFEEMVCLP